MRTGSVVISTRAGLIVGLLYHAGAAPTVTVLDGGLMRSAEDIRKDREGLDAQIKYELTHLELIIGSRYGLSEYEEYRHPYTRRKLTILGEFRGQTFYQEAMLDLSHNESELSDRFMKLALIRNIISTLVDSAVSSKKEKA